MKLYCDNKSTKSALVIIRCSMTEHVTPQSRGSVDYPSTRGIQVDVGLPDVTSENRAESHLYGELYPSTIPAYTCPKQCNRSNISNHMRNTAT